MKNFIAAAMLALAVPCRAGMPSLDLGKGYSIGISEHITDVPAFDGARDYYNGQWLSGYCIEVGALALNGNELVYIAGTHLFNADEAGKGAVAVALGIKPINAINAIARVIGGVDQLITLPPFASKIGDFLSIEAGHGYRFQNTPGVSRRIDTIGGQLKVPFDLKKGL